MLTKVVTDILQKKSFLTTNVTKRLPCDINVDTKIAMYGDKRWYQDLLP